MILIIDNYDSFTYNLVQRLGELGAEMTVVRNDKITVAEVREMKPDAVIISPGPCTPKEAGISVEAIQKLHMGLPILGVCLGHQAIGEAFGGRVVHAPKVVHGKTSQIFHDGQSILQGVESPLVGARYHSLIIDRKSLPECLEVTAWTADELIMGVRHKEFPTIGVQFHPESIATESGLKILKNFVERKY
ncbi:MAG: aminodeoxychorismate/anthranilate synthase component II [Bacteroidota bacterium]